MWSSTLNCKSVETKKNIKIEHIRGSGPGGQHRNKRMTGVRIYHLPTGITVEATERRSQFQNKQVALERLKIRLVKHFHKRKPRIATHVSAGADTKRLNQKTQRAKIKRNRKNVRENEEV